MPDAPRHWLFAPFTAAPVVSDPGRYALIDLARGAAAVCVLFRHYNHFSFRPGTFHVPPDLTAFMPWWTALWPVYEFGQYAVQMFWLISGFVFAKVYAARSGTTGGFVLNRFARLYPLHLVTLLVVAGLQAVSLARNGYWLICDHNDAKHFLMHLAFASNWSRGSPTTFNGPIWSVSVEVLVYAAFWLALPVLFVRGVLVPLALAAAFFALAAAGANDLVCSCGTYFFIGSAVYVLHQRWRAGVARQVVAAGLTVLAGVALIATRFHTSFATPLLGGGVLLGLAGLEATTLPGRLRRLDWVGESTYGIYLCHVPLQLAILLLLPVVGLSRDVMRSPWALLAFVAVSVAIGRASYVLLERPAQRWIRSWATTRRERRAAEAGPKIAAP